MDVTGLDNHVGELMRVVPHRIVLVDHVGRKHLGIMPSVPLGRHHIAAPVGGTGRVQACIGDHHIEQLSVHMALHGHQEVLRAVLVGLAGLGGHVADKHSVCGRRGDRTRDVVHQQVWQDARVEAARADHDDVRIQNRLHGLGVGPGLGRLQKDARDGRASVHAHIPRSMILVHVRLAVHVGLIAQYGDQHDILQGRGQDLPLHSQHAA